MSINIQALKIAPLLAAFLYEHKHLHLPGIGSFSLDASTIVEPENNKSGKPVPLEGLHFQSNLTTAEDPELISYISAQSGKMKALASADLSSHLELAQQFLNIGKPFVLEGIGNLVKIKGGFEFTPGYALTEKVREYTPATVAQEEATADYKEVLYHQPANPAWRKPLIASLAVFGLALAIWGGYTIYKNSKDNAASDTNETATVQAQQNTEPAQQQPSTITPDTLPAKKDTTVQTAAPVTPVVIPPSGTYKFVVEVADKTRGLDRFRALKSWGLSVQMETADSVKFTIFFRLPAHASDTLRIRDSLGQLYTPYWTKAFVRN